MEVKVKNKFFSVIILFVFLLSGCSLEEEKRCLGITPTLSEDGKTITYGLYPQSMLWILL